MRPIRLSLSAAALLAGLGYAAAQVQQGDPGQQQRHDQMLQTVPGKNGKEEPSAHAAGSSPDANAVFVDGKLNVPGAPQDGETVPAKFSSHNHEIDVLPIMAYPIKLTDAQKQRIADSVKASAPVAIDAKPADMLPVTTPATELPKEVAQDIPGIGGLKVIRTRDKILLVRSSNMVVRDVFTY
jgi:hypothetical protein